MRRFVETKRGEAVEGGGFRAFLPIEWKCQLSQLLLLLSKLFTASPVSYVKSHVVFWPTAGESNWLKSC